MITLYDLAEGEEGIIIRVRGRGRFRQRLMEMGFIPGKKVTVVKKAPLLDPVEYRIMEYNVSIRNSEAKLIEIDRNGKDVLKKSGDHQGEFFNEIPWIGKSREIVVALAGNPNSGKTTLFNRASGSREKVANYPGVTVDSKISRFRQSGYTFSLVDLPGAYSLKSYSPEEIFIRNFLMKNNPDVVINIIDATNLERNLYLTTQLIDMGVQTVVALNMYDELKNRGDSLNHKLLGKLLGIPVIPTISSKGKGIHELFEKVIEVYENREPITRHIHINYGPELEDSLIKIQAKIKIAENSDITNFISSRFLAIELLENDREFSENISGCVNHAEIIGTAAVEKEKLVKLFSDPLEDVITDLRYGFIAGALKETLVIKKREGLTLSEKIDNFLTDKYAGIPIFGIFMWITFFTTFKLGGYPKHWLETGIARLSEFVSQALPRGIINDFISGGLINGAGGVIVFLPNILILFLFISFMEDTGYMARAVFMMDRVMHRIGLHGKSFIPLFMGFGCNVPAIMATRIIESRRDRMLTMLITPFMSCSARLPVYILFISAFFASNQGTVLFILYLLGATFAIITALILKRVFFRKEEIPFVMELPPYRMPSLRSYSKHIWFRTGLYLKKIGGIILLASIVVWFLSNFPKKTNFAKDYNSQIVILTEELNSTKGNAGNLPDGPVKTRITGLEDSIFKIRAEKHSEEQSASFMGLIGRTIEPVMKPLGFDWRLSVSILSGVAAKEVVVSTLGILYQAGEKNGKNSLVDKIRDQKDAYGRKAFTPVIAFSFMLFILTYFPCMGVVAAIRRESGSWKWSAFIVGYTTAIAWLLSFITFQAGNLLG